MTKLILFIKKHDGEIFIGIAYLLMILILIFSVCGYVNYNDSIYLEGNFFQILFGYTNDGYLYYQNVAINDIYAIVMLLLPILAIASLSLKKLFKKYTYIVSSVLLTIDAVLFALFGIIEKAVLMKTCRSLSDYSGFCATVSIYIVALLLLTCTLYVFLPTFLEERRNKKNAK